MSIQAGSDFLGQQQWRTNFLIQGGSTPFSPTCAYRMVSGCFDESFKAFDPVEIFDPVTDQWTLSQPMKYSRSGHTSTLLKNGRILITGGFRFAFIPESSLECYELTR